MKAVGLMCVAIAFFSCLDASAKYLASSAHIPVAQLVWVRFLGQFLAIIFIAGLAGVPALLSTKKLPLQLVRSVLMVATTAANFLALQWLRLDQTVTIVFLAPLVVALLAGPLLGEWVGWRRLIAVIVGFIGILIATRPGYAEFNPGVAYALGGMLAYALFMLLTRHLAAFDPPLVTLFYSMFAGVLFAAPLAIDQWVSPPTPFAWLLMILLGAFGGIGHYLFILAYRLAPASAIAPFIYLQLVSMIALGYVVFGDVPDAWTLAGASVVIMSGIYLLHRERMTRGGDITAVAIKEPH